MTPEVTESLQVGKMIAGVWQEGRRKLITIYDGQVEATISLREAKALHEWLGRELQQPAQETRAATETSAAHVHVWEPDNVGGAVCKCGTYADGWYCSTSPTKLCVYTKSFDSCDRCGLPEERK